MDQRNEQQLALNAMLNNHYALLQQSNDTVNLMQNALASGVPTLDIPSIISYLGYSNSFLQNSNTNKENNSFEAKYQKLLEVIEEIGNV